MSEPAVEAKDTWWLSSPYAVGLERALKKQGKLEEVLKHARPATVEMLTKPSSKPWWEAEPGTDVTTAQLAVGGAALVRETGRLAVFESMSPIVRPFVSVLLTISGSTPATFFSRYGQLARTALKNVTFSWTAAGPTSGTLVVVYPARVLPEFADSWQGAFDFTFEVTRTKGEQRCTFDGFGTLTFEMSWR